MGKTNNIRKLQLIELNILKEVASVCDKHNLIYYLSEGTLLGAIRHGGFIPWDDDVDVCMPREDYEIFAKVAQIDLPEYMDIIYFRNSDDDKKDHTFFMHPCDNRYKIMWKTKCDKDMEILPVWIDVTPLDGLPQKRLLRTVHLIHMKLLYKMIRCSVVQQISTDRELAWWKRFVIFVAKKMRLDKLNTKKCFEKYDAAAKSYPFKSTVNVINYGSDYGKIAFKSWYGDGRMIKFEDAKFRVPNEAGKLLMQEYGDYLTLPPEGERKPKHIILLEKDEREGGGNTPQN